MTSLIDWLGMGVYLVSLIFHLALLIQIARTLIPKLLGNKLTLRDGASLLLSVVVLLLTVKYMPVLFIDAVMEGYSVAMPKYLDFGETIVNDFRESQEGRVDIDVYESDYFSVPYMAQPEAPPQATGTPSPVPTLDLNRWNPATPPPTPSP